MIKKIPIEFYYKGALCKGHFTEVFGGGANTWHLMINNYYKGQLIYSQNGWAFYNNSGEMKCMTEYFGEHMMLWYE